MGSVENGQNERRGESCTAKREYTARIWASFEEFNIMISF